jgi:acyl carrier protein
MKLAEVEGRIERFIREEFAVSPSDPGFSRDADLFEGGYIDSVGIMELVGFIEREFDVDVPEDDLLSEDFSRIEGIARIIERHLARDQEPELWAS